MDQITKTADKKTVTRIEKEKAARVKEWRSEGDRSKLDSAIVAEYGKVPMAADKLPIAMLRGDTDVRRWVASVNKRAGGKHPAADVLERTIVLRKQGLLKRLSLTVAGK